MIAGYMDFQDQDLVNYGLWAESWPPPVFIQVQTKNGFHIFFNGWKEEYFCDT